LGGGGRRAEAIGNTLTEGNDRATGVLLELVARNVTGISRFNFAIDIGTFAWYKAPISVGAK
jgi:hypothetical protein